MEIISNVPVAQAYKRKVIGMPSIAEEINRAMQAFYPEGEPGAALAIMKDGKLILENGYGSANMHTGERITVATNFRMASVSKQFTAFSILLLFMRHEISLEDTISRFFDHSPFTWRPVTIRQLLTHTSGLPDYETVISPNRQTQVSDEEVLQLIEQEESLYFPAGSGFKYSNTGYCLLAMIVQSVSGSSYADFVKENIVQPLGMEYSQVYENNKAIVSRAYGYRPVKGGYQPADQNRTSATKGDGGIYTSVADYLKWHKALHLNTLIPAKFTNNMFVPQVPVREGISYGYGWFVGMEKDGSPCRFHSGESTGFRNIVYCNPEKRLLIVLFSNREDDTIAIAFDKIAKQLDIQISFDDEQIPNRKFLFHRLHDIYGE